MDLVDVGTVLLKAGKHEEALKCFDKAIDLEPEHANIWLYKGVCLFSLATKKIGNFDQPKLESALEYIDRATEMEPENADMWFWKGLTLVSLGRGDEAKKYLDKAKQLAPDKYVD